MAQHEDSTYKVRKPDLHPEAHRDACAPPHCGDEPMTTTILTEAEIMALLPGAVRLPPGWRDTARAVEAAVLAKLAAMNAPVAWKHMATGQLESAASFAMPYNWGDRSEWMPLYPPAAQDREGVVLSGYRVGSGLDAIRVERVQQIDGPDLWAVRLHGACLGKGGEWEYEPFPSSRTKEWLTEHRFDSAETAIDAARAAMKGTP
jgi:hypothetical protein